MKFPQAKGKTLEDLEFSTHPEDHAITLLFRDKTALRLEIEPGFTMFADYADLKTGDWRPKKRWPPVRSQLLRD